ncbi:hypothetical protein B7494_g5466 [Chlorociboria aeruginascens]|nr:hypothetical protein B7494_g5466 [Chlorociboria aeruginascens]
MRPNWLQSAKPQTREVVMDSSIPSLHTPTVEDVLSVKKILQDMHNGPHLPMELVDAIIDVAEYWPHTTTSMDTTIRVFSHDENRFVLRSFPLGFVEATDAEYQILPEFTNKYAYITPEPWPESRGFPQDATNEVLEQWKSRSQPRGEQPCLERLNATRELALLKARELPCFPLRPASSTQATPLNASPIVCSLQTLLPRTITVASNLDSTDISYEFEHPLLPSANLLQKNRAAVKNLQENIIEWSYDDHISRDSTEGIELKTKGRGEATLEGNYVRNLKIGDVITVWAKARFPGWVNTVEQVKMDVYWAVYHRVIIFPVGDFKSLRSLFGELERLDAILSHFPIRFTAQEKAIITASRSEDLPFLVYTSDSDSGSPFEGEELERERESDRDRRRGRMAEAKSTGVGTHEANLGGRDHKSSDGLEGVAEVRSNEEVRTDEDVDGVVLENAIEAIEGKKTAWYAYLTTRDFWIVLVIGQVLALCITATNTFSTLLVNKGTSIPAFQTLFNYILLTIVYTTYTIYTYGPKKYAKLLLVDGWKYILLSFMDVEGNYFTVLAYRYTNLLSAQLLNFWSIVCVVIVSVILLRVRYKLAQILGILICCGGMGILLASDHITGSNGGDPPTQLKGDLFGLAGATFYGLSNVFEEWFVSKRPMYEVLGMLGLFGVIINGITAAIFDRASFASATWDGQVGGYIVGYTLALFIFYSLAPLILRMASAAFFDISLLTGNFWGVIIGIKVFGYTIYYLYPIAFVLIILGLITYFLAGSMLGDSLKPWLGHNQERGVAGIGTAKQRAIREARREDLRGERVV